MWENETPDNREVAAQNDTEKPQRPLLTPPDTRQGETVLLIQAFICIAFIVFVLALRTFYAPLFQNLQTEYRVLMANGLDLSGQGELIRFANNTIEGIREAATDIFAKLDEASDAASVNGAGGEAKTAGNAVPDNATQLSYRLTDKPFCPVNGRFSSGFGIRKNPVTRKTDFHTGIDIAAAKGSDIFAAFPGIVEETGYDKTRGNYVVICHSQSLKTLYQHMSKITVKKGDLMIRGARIGTVGSTGLSTGPHLHFEIHINGKCVEPSYAIVLDQL